MTALNYLILRYRLWRHVRRQPTHTVRFETDHRSVSNVTPGTEWYRAYPHLAKQKDNPNG